MIHIELKINPLLEPNKDFLFFERSVDGEISWNIIDSFDYTNTINTYNYDIQEDSNSIFRFRFYSNDSINTYIDRQGEKFYYIDILDFKISCISYLPVELIYFKSSNIKNYNLLEWKTGSELNNDYFIIENSIDGYNWNILDTIDGSGNSSINNKYSLNHYNFEKTINYYKLTQVDYNGTKESFNIIALNNINTKYIIKRVNILNQEIDKYYKGIVIEYYNDNTIIKKLYK